MHSTALVSCVSDYDLVVEVGIGDRLDVATACVEAGTDVIAIDIYPGPVGAGIDRVQGDVHRPPIAGDAPIGAIVANNLPAELQRPSGELARWFDVPLYFTTLGGEVPVVPTEIYTVEGDTVYVARPDGLNKVL